MNRHLGLALPFALATLALAVAPDAARADNTSMFTVGVGAGVGVRHAGAPGESADVRFMNHGSVRLKAFNLIAADLSVDLTKDPVLTAVTPGDLRFAAKLRMTALFYPISTSYVQVYLGGGLGAASASELFSVTSPGNSYHVGAGVEFHVNDHVTLDLSFFMLIPGYHSVRGHVEQLALTYAEDAAADIARGGAAPSSVADLPLSDLGVGTFVSPRNFEVMARFYVYL